MKHDVRRSAATARYFAIHVKSNYGNPHYTSIWKVQLSKLAGSGMESIPDTVSLKQPIPAGQDFTITWDMLLDTVGHNQGWFPQSLPTPTIKKNALLLRCT